MDKQKLIQVARKFADTVMDRGKDHYGKESTPLLIDGLNLKTGEPLYWEYEGRKMILSNFARQQILVRTFEGLTNFTGDERYADRFREIAEYMFEEYQQQSGLIPWGTHLFIDLENNQYHDIGKGLNHELHGWFPHFEFLWEIDSGATEKLIKGIWDGHIHNWGTLVFNRHADIHQQVDFDRVWDREFEDPEPLIPTKSKLTFIDCGSHIIDAGTRLYALNEDQMALTWARRMHNLYRKARHPETGLGGYQFTSPIAQRKLPPLAERFPINPRQTYSDYGDRARNVFGDDFGEIAREANFLHAGEVLATYGVTAAALMRLAENLGEEGREWLNDQVDGLKAYAEYAYISETGRLRPIWADGTDLTGYEPEWPGYYRSRLADDGTLKAFDVPHQLFFSFALAYRLSGDGELWPTLRGIAENYGLGDLGFSPGERVEPNLETATCEPRIMLALLELHRASGAESYLELAKKIGENMIETCFKDGLFVDEESGEADFCRVEPFALLKLAEACAGDSGLVTPFISHEGRVYN